MMTRTVGVVTGATMLMLIFQTVQSLSTTQGIADETAFLAGFHAAFRTAAGIPVLVVLAAWRRGWARTS
jgi:hypothetical protein